MFRIFIKEPRAIGLNLKAPDIRSKPDNRESPTLGVGIAAGNAEGLEITQSPTFSRRREWTIDQIRLS